MSSGLHAQKDCVEGDGYKGQRPLLRMGKGRADGGYGVVRQDERQDRQRDDDTQVGVGALKVVVLFAIFPGADQKRYADHSVENDHDHSY